MIKSKFDGLISLKEGSILVNKEESTIRKHIFKGLFNVGYDCQKFGKQWVFDENALINKYLKEDIMDITNEIYETNYNGLMQLLNDNSYTNGKVVNMKSSNLQLLFNIIDRSLINAELDSEKQYVALCEILEKEDNTTNEKLYDTYSIVALAIFRFLERDDFMNELCENLEISNEDDLNNFACWIIGRGGLFVENLIRYGVEYVINYINKYNIQEYDYCFESLVYPFLKNIEEYEHYTVRNVIKDNIDDIDYIDDIDIDYLLEIINDSFIDNEFDILSQAKEIEISLDNMFLADVKKAHCLWKLLKNYFVCKVLNNKNLCSKIKLQDGEEDYFVSWILSRGEDFLNNILAKGTNSILEYIEQNDISNKVYTSSIFDNLFIKYSIFYNNEEYKHKTYSNLYK